MSKDGYRKGMNLALRNASGLLKEPEVLLGERRYARSFAMGALALEEIGKVVFLAVAADPGWSELPEKTLREFWKKFTDHAAKMNFLLGYRWKTILYVRRRKLPPVQEEARYKALVRAYRDVLDYMDSIGVKHIEQLKLRCFYVDTDARSRRFVPQANIPKRVAKAMILIGQSNLKDARRLRDTFRRSDVERLSEVITISTFKGEMMEETLRQLEEADTSQ